ncbi:beta-ketoacyl synthase [Aestuariicella hydrocarbonica]|uniref:Beta-ketoacyl synthase n=1 Tax=Pseudomaricurvus hydrocarbonicus TaxID=1470433 RepID=A0A9E5MLS7_9GAMM|nr:beta-ketoacyl synthase [Aestuariicella hydrocarbonica]NHO65378.1 beta-ketoacyl synthase [Aestuariicella hydrocarbonica]
MSRLPIIAGFGGYNAAGRSSFHHGFRRMVIESLDEQSRQETLAGLGVMTQQIKADESGFTTLTGEPVTLAEIESRFGEQILQATLIRRIEKSHFDVDAAPWQQSVTVAPNEGSTTFLLSRYQLPKVIPKSWTVSDYSDTHVRVDLADNCEVKVDSTRLMDVQAAGQLPTGFEPSELYNSRFHPRGLQMTIVGVSDALHSLGIPWSTVKSAVHPDEIAVYAGSVMSQADEYGFGGVMQSRLKGSRVTAKQLPLGLNTMPADFINAYVLGSVGTTGSTTGACATFLYNLKQGVEAIQSGKARVVIAGNSEAPITQEIIDGFAAMSALGTTEGLKKVEGSDTPDLRRSSRPFGENCGFTIAEACQFVVLMDDELVVELGAQIHGAVTDVFVNADGFKKSISAPGPGNYITLAKAVSSAREVVGQEGIQKRSMVHAHGSSTPANRQTESELFDRIAEVFGIADWPVAAVKAYVGHSIGPASGDQLMAALGSFKYGLIPGIKTIDKVADDVHQERLSISVKDTEKAELDVAFINTKGFGGNNATGVVLSPTVAKKMLTKRHGAETMAAYEVKLQGVIEAAQAYDQAALHGDFNIVYNFGIDMIDDKAMAITDTGVTIPGLQHAVTFPGESRYTDMI